MFEFTALIYTGTVQQLVRHQCTDKQAFFEQLLALHGVFICIWLEQKALSGEASTSH